MVWPSKKGSRSSQLWVPGLPLCRSASVTQVQHFLSEPRSLCQGYSSHTFHWSPKVLQCGIASTKQRRPSLPKDQGNSCWLCLNDIRHLSILQGCQTSKGIPDSGEGKRILFSLRVASIYSLSSCCFTESPQPTPNSHHSAPSALMAPADNECWGDIQTEASSVPAPQHKKWSNTGWICSLGKAGVI